MCEIIHLFIGKPHAKLFILNKREVRFGVPSYRPTIHPIVIHFISSFRLVVIFIPKNALSTIVVATGKISASTVR